MDNQIENEEVKHVIDIIREQFVWGNSYDKDNNRLKETKYVLLKDLETSHILIILSYFTNGAYLMTDKNADGAAIV
ncbi:hypothetical protein, partial [Streptococcus pneumoniae]|uniref:hypothetical protein n=1 Tax=Streptococcus pneumoniae TaxID=1313 RepID=UPI00139C1CD9